MPYAQLDDGFYDHPRFEKVDDDLVGIWAKGLAYCSRHLSDGRIPKRIVYAFCVSTDPATVVMRMVASALWRDVGDAVEHVGYLDHNPSKAEVRAKQQGNKARKDRWKLAHEEPPEERVPERDRNGASPSLPPSLPVVNTYVRGADISGPSKDVRRVFEYWLKVLAPLKWRRTPSLTPDRRRLIETRLKESSVAELCQAIDGVRQSPHHCGKNDQGEIYVDFHTIFRNRSKVDGHRARAEGTPPMPPMPASAQELESRKTGRVQEELLKRFENR